VPADFEKMSLVRPRSLSAALSLLTSDPTLTPLAGCTDVYVGLHFGTTPHKRFIDLWRLKELHGISVDRGVLRIGATTTYAEIIASKLVQKRVPMLAAAAREVGGAQIQNRGTLGGNVANASPAGDTLPVLAAAGARIVLRSHAGTRTVPFDAFYTGYRTSVRTPEELITAIEIPRIDGRQWWRKVGTRRAQAISKIMMAAVRGKDIRIAFGSIAPTVVLAQRAAAVLSNGGGIDHAREALLAEIAPIDDIRSTAAYRATVAGNLLEEFWRVTE
jgi:xanthine dehydrogenase small subunit